MDNRARTIQIESAPANASRQRAEEISSLIPQAARRADEGRHDDLLRAQAGLPRLRAQAPVLPERACAQNRTLVHEAARDKVRAIAKTEA
jgi:hypothetical protein